MRDLEALMFSELMLRLEMVVSKRDCNAPNFDRWLDTTAMDASTVDRVRVAASTVDTSSVLALCNSLAAETPLK